MSRISVILKKFVSGLIRPIDTEIHSPSDPELASVFDAGFESKSGDKGPCWPPEKKAAWEAGVAERERLDQLIQ